MIQQDVHKWITTSTYVDVDTGECITKADVERETYYITKKTKDYDFTEEIRNGKVLKYGWKIYQYQCRTTGQQKLFD